MNSEQIVAEVIDALAAFLADRGFDRSLRSQSDFVKSIAVGDQRISPEVFKWPSEGTWHVTFRLKVRFREIEDLLIRYGRPTDASESSCVVNRLIDNLYPKNIENFDWSVAGPQDVARVAPAMRSRLEEYALPFFEAVKDVSGLRKALEDESGNWPVPTAEMRAQVLLLSLALLKDCEGFATWLPRLRASVARARGGFFKDRFEGFIARLKTDFPEIAALVV